MDVVDVVYAFEAAHHKVGDDVVALVGRSDIGCIGALVHWCIGDDVVALVGRGARWLH